MCCLPASVAAPMQSASSMRWVSVGSDIYRLAEHLAASCCLLILSNCHQCCFKAASSDFVSSLETADIFSDRKILLQLRGVLIRL